MVTDRTWGEGGGEGRDGSDGSGDGRSSVVVDRSGEELPDRAPTGD
jgi:hypothetical protein